MSAAEKAVLHLLRQVQYDGRLAYLIGLGSQSFDLLTQAEAERTGEDHAELKKRIWANCSPERITTTA
jgi:hypothetical protein